MTSETRVDASGLDARERFAQDLRTARELHPEGPLSQTELARRARTSKTTVSRVENGVGPVPPTLPVLFDQIFRTDGHFKRLYEEAVASSFPALYRRRMALEKTAVAVWEWSPTIVPGLFQTGAYARALLRRGDPRAGEEEIGALVGARLARQDLLRGASPPVVRLIICESVLGRRVGTAEVMRDQLAALLAHTQRLTTRIQVLPLDAEPHLLIDSPITLLTTPQHQTYACVEAFRTAAIIEDVEQVRNALRAYDELTSEALSARDSAALIREKLDTW
ncbi:helix-turn-helix transcriptional regulator [uncultured Streptomyces sp.]|uniref:helix-turn-helix domain-containing protein n=1 Tax=uncultured Streptomyces sp. TaxID=174707 RepID=UPI00261996CC|nr:helix-turn-helix transcriptional regulator [uncultured Streptomyces sp.]